MIKVLTETEKEQIVPAVYLREIKLHKKKKGIVMPFERGDCAGNYLAFQIDDNAHYTGEVALCDSVREIREFAYPPLRLELLQNEFCKSGSIHAR
jgi:hypothetical protein